jgi:hypothetical protein
VFDPFLRGWFDQHAFQSVTTEQFVAYLKEPAGAASGRHAAAELDEWLYGTGAGQRQRVVSPRLALLDQQRDAWLKGELATKDLGMDKWIAMESMHFLNDIDGKASARRCRSWTRSTAWARAATTKSPTASTWRP